MGQRGRTRAANLAKRVQHQKLRDDGWMDGWAVMTTAQGGVCGLVVSQSTAPPTPATPPSPRSPGHYRY